ncbi:hypothetical protein BH24CHL2_BH24CHL2_6300 [soil metagenome]|jgi:RNA polymerase sigma factor (sigma-70 family)
MDVVGLVNMAKTGDVDAFTELVRRYQAMAFGYAYSNLRDFHLAEDAVQQAFVVAYNNLHRIDHPERFGGWLRAIVRFECLHLLRSRRVVQVPIDAVSELAAPEPGPAELAEEREGIDRILLAIDGLPPTEREATILYYIHDHSQQDVAEFLNLPVTTVNNRLRSARKRLKEERIVTMSQDTFREHGLPDDFTDRIGEIVRVQGPIVDVRFPADNRPPILSALTITDGTADASTMADVTQYLDDDLVRCIISARGHTITSAGGGMRVIGIDEQPSAPIEAASITQVIASMRRPAATPRVLETGIKAIDVLTPLPSGGVIGLVGDAQTGKMVLVEELIHRLTDASEAISILVFVEAQDEARVVRSLEYRTSAAVEAVYLPVADASPEALEEINSEFDAVITLSRRLAEDRLYPAIDIVRSSSRMLDRATVGKEHVDVAMGVRQLLEHAARRPDVDSDGHTAETRRAAQLQRFLTQPFFVAEPFTKQPGVSVPRNAAVEGCAAMLQGAHDGLTEEILYMAGTLDDALART